MTGEGLSNWKYEGESELTAKYTNSFPRTVNRYKIYTQYIFCSFSSLSQLDPTETIYATKVGDDQPTKPLKQELSDQDVDTMYHIKYDDFDNKYIAAATWVVKMAKTYYPDIFSLSNEAEII